MHSGLSKRERRDSLALAHAQGALWSVGNGLTSGPFVSYLAQDLRADARQLALILAMPALVGALRLAAPWLMRRRGGTKPVAIGSLLAAYSLIWAVPALLFGPHRPDLLPALVAVICAHQLCEYIGLVAVSAWLAELLPRRIRGRYLGRRNAWQVGTMIPFAAAGAWYADHVRNTATSVAEKTQAYTAPFAVGAALLLLSILPLARMKSARSPRERPIEPLPFRSLALHRPFRRLLMYGCWLSLFNGLVQSPQNIFPSRVLHLSVTTMVAMHVVTRAGQLLLSNPLGRACDRYGNRPVMIVCQLIVATSGLFYLWSTPQQWGWVIGAWIAFAFYAGINVGIPSLTYKLASRAEVAAFIAVYYALTGVVYATATLIGGDLFERFRSETFEVGGMVLDGYRFFFYVGWVTRSLAALFLLAVVEPGAWSLWEMLRAQRKEPPTETADAV